MMYTCGVFLVNNKGKLLICHITGRPRTGEGTWSIPKGLLDEGEKLEEAAQREIKEEAGIDVELDSLMPYSWVEYKSKRKTLVPFYCKTNKNLPNPVCTSYFTDKNGIKKPEVDDFAWVDFDEARLLLHETQNQVLDEIMGG